MKEYRFIRLLVDYYNYLLLLTLLSNFIWFDSSLEAFLWLGILLVIPYLISKARQFLHLGEKKQERAVEEDSERRLTCHVGLLIGIGILATSATVTSERPEHLFLCCLFYIAAIGVFFFWRYYSGKYLVLYRNPSVSKNTRTRAERRIQNSLVRLALIGAAAVVFIFIVASLVPEVQITPISTESTPEPERKEKEERKDPVAVSQTERPRMPEEQREDSILLLIVRYIAWVLVVVFAVIGILLLLFKVVMFFMGMRNRGEYEYYELLEEKTDNEEYARLIPVIRKGISFPAGNAGKVRRAFYKAVKKGADGSRIENSHTPYELREKYLTEKEDSEFLTELYEKARYSEDEVSDREVSRISK